MQTLKKLLYFLTPPERKSAILLLFMIFVMALLDMIGVASIMPFIAVLTNPSIIETNFILNTVFKYSNFFGIETKDQFLFALGLIVFLIIIITISFKALTEYMQYRFVAMREYNIGRRLLENYLKQPYSWFLNRNSADIGKTILSEVATIVGGSMKPMLELIAKSAVTIALLILLIVANPKLTLYVGFSLSGAYGLIYLLLRSRLTRIGEDRFNANQTRFKIISEAFGAAKEVKVAGLEEIYIKRFAAPAKIFANVQASANLIGQLPRFALEAIAFGGMLLAILYLMSQKGDFTSALPTIALYAYAGYRLLPALQNIYKSNSQLRFIAPALDSVYQDYKNLKSYHLNQDQSILPFNNNICLKNICYEYPNSSRTALKNVSLNIPSGATVGIVGTTGSGKTTTVDIILGLLEAKEGSLEVDGKVINKQNSRDWQKSIGYVPQHIYLTDDTVIGNITLGIDPKDIDLEAVEKAAKIANIHEFVINELPRQYQTTVGERGVRLSGGQRQRIGIARALYNKPKLLIMDEATSSLDNQTEKIVMEAVNNIHKDVTIILIAHRLSTVKKCDIIYLLEKGELKNKGTFEELINVDENFKKSVSYI
jgi:ABC-type multidrug transport system fused ATPase/permease subunit